jgi:hypothetical protein
MTKKNRQESAKPAVNSKFGIGEWYGLPFASIDNNKRVELSNLRTPKSQICTFRTELNPEQPCTKRGGVCSLRQYEKNTETNFVAATSKIVTLCPHRLKEGNKIFQWVGETVLGHSEPIIVTEIGFLIREQASELGSTAEDDANLESVLPSDAREDVGQIDYVLVHPETREWCALELQAVYFSGPAMSKEYETIRETPNDTIPFPAKNRRPDYRSSGPKRLMPQLQIKVPTLRRWGKKMAVVIDNNFYRSLGQMDRVQHISNCDIVWFVVDYDTSNGKIELITSHKEYTTLERAVEGLTAGRPVELPTFETSIERKIRDLGKPKRTRPVER